MRKRACVLAIVLFLATVAGPALAADRSDERPTGLRDAVAWVLDLVGYGDVERAAPDARQKHGAVVIVDGSPAPLDNGDEISGPGTGIDG